MFHCQPKDLVLIRHSHWISEHRQVFDAHDVQRRKTPSRQLRLIIGRKFYPMGDVFVNLGQLSQPLTHLARRHGRQVALRHHAFQLLLRRTSDGQAETVQQAIERHHRHGRGGAHQAFVREDLCPQHQIFPKSRREGFSFDKSVDAVGQHVIVDQQHSAQPGRKRLIPLTRQECESAESSTQTAVITRAERVAAIFDDWNAARGRPLLDGGHVARNPVSMLDD